MARRVFDFGEETNKVSKEDVNKINYEIIYTSSDRPSITDPIIRLGEIHEEKKELIGKFINPSKGSGFKENTSDKIMDIQAINARFVGFIEWLSLNNIEVKLEGETCENVFCVLNIVESDERCGKLSAGNGFVRFMMERLLSCNMTKEEFLYEDDIDDDSMKLTSIQSMRDFLDCAGNTFPPNIRKWAMRNMQVANSSEVSQEERRHAQRALSIMLNINWKSSSFKSIDVSEARKILDEELYGMDSVKQRVIETCMQINRTGKLPAYGILLVGPAGTGKSRIAYAIAKILKLPYASIDMSSINDIEQLSGSSRIYANAKPGSIMEAFMRAGQSNLVFIINELDKADTKSSSNPADALLTLLDNIGYTDNYMECMIPTTGVYPVATANDKSKISNPLLTRFAVIDIPDYTFDEKKIIFTKYAFPKVLERLNINDDECILDEETINYVISKYQDVSGVRDLEQVAEHLASHALFLLETTGQNRIEYNKKMVENII